MTVGSTRQEQRAAKWAERIFLKKVRPGQKVPEPEGREATCAAVARFGELARGAGVMQDSVEGARRGAKKLSTDPLQGLSEVVQNAEDVGAREVRVLIRGKELLLAHNGRPIRLTDVMPLSMPWVTSKSEDAEATGRFGIGLMTLFTFSPWIEVHSGHYRLRISESGVAVAASRSFPEDLGDDGWTVFRIPLTRKNLSTSDVDTWLGAWGHEALLFLRRVGSVVHLDGKGRVRQRLAIRRQDDSGFVAEVADETVQVTVSEVSAPDGSHWQVCHTAVKTPPGVEPEGKAAGDTTPLAVALPLGKARAGYLHVRLPVTPIGLSLRVHAQFDPVPSRQDLMRTNWNDALVPRVADLWAAALVERFRRNPATSWDMLPLPQDMSGGHGVIADLEEAILERSRRQVSIRLSIEVFGHGSLTLPELAIEDAELTGVVTEADIARVAQCPVLPFAARDPEGRYRDILKDWELHGKATPKGVTVWDALELLGDPDRPLEAVIELAATSIAGGWAQHRLAHFPWLADESCVRYTPPGEADLQIFTDRLGGLAASLGFAHVLHPAFLADTPAASQVREWLRARHALLLGDDQVAVIRRLADYGRARGSITGIALSDDQLRELKDAFAQVPEHERPMLGSGAGRAIRLQAFCYTADGRRHEVAAAPADAYLPPGIENTERSESFAFAAGSVPGLTWLRPRYQQVLRASRTGMSPLNFLRTLGAESGPRLRMHRHSTERLGRMGVTPHVQGSPSGRTRLMNRLGATHTLDDYESRDLDAVVNDIASESDPHERRRRAIALIHVLGRAWSVRLSNHEQVMAGHAYYTWELKKRIAGFWLWKLRETPWLDSESGTITAPAALRRRTAATAAVYGTDADGFLHSEIQEAIVRRGDVMRALDISGEPTVDDMLGHLRKTRQREQEGGDRDHAAALILYQALADKMAESSLDSYNAVKADVIRAFRAGDGLILTESGWRTPEQCLRGKPLFGLLRDFAPDFNGSDALWELLGVALPTVDDAIDVIKELAPSTPTRQKQEPEPTAQAILLQTLQYLQDTATRNPTELKGKRLGRLPLWTSQGWVRGRPVYAIEEASLAAALEGEAALWHPGAELERLHMLLPYLGIAVIGNDAVRPSLPGPCDPAVEATALVALAVGHLREDLQRNDPATAHELEGSWEELADLAVRIAPELACTVTLADVGAPICVPVETTIDWQEGILYTRSVDVLSRSSGTGRSIAARFRRRRREVAYAWSSAWERAAAGLDTTEIIRAEDRIREQEAAATVERERRLAELQQEMSHRHASASRVTKPSKRKDPRASETAAPTNDSRTGQTRRLIDPDEMRPALAQAEITQRDPSAAGSVEDRGRRSGLPQPRFASAVPQQRTAPREYTMAAQEEAALNLVGKALARDSEELRDLRAQRGVGADAVDELKRFYEVKSHSCREPDSISLTPKEYERAQTDKDFFLVVVSGLEAGAGETIVRIILDPLGELKARPNGNVTLNGIHGCRSLRIPFEQDK